MLRECQSVDHDSLVPVRGNVYSEASASELLENPEASLHRYYVNSNPISRFKSSITHDLFQFFYRELQNCFAIVSCSLNNIVEVGITEQQIPMSKKLLWKR